MIEEAAVWRLRARVLLFWARANPGKTIMVWSVVRSRLEWPVASAETFMEFMLHLPDEIDVEWDGRGVTITMEGEVGEEERKPVTGPLDEVKQIFTYWKVKTGRSDRTVFSEDRKRRIRARMREGFTVSDLRKAVDGLMQSAFHRGENESGTTYTDIKHVFRDAEAVERHMGVVGNRSGNRAETRLDGIRDQARRRRGRRR